VSGFDGFSGSNGFAPSPGAIGLFAAEAHSPIPFRLTAACPAAQKLWDRLTAANCRASGIPGLRQ